nr:hypothetical protein [Candidatus Sigynarchaeota archaeon]
MGSTHKEFILFEGPVEDGFAKMNLLNYIKYAVNPLEKDKVNYSYINFTIGNHTFQYDALQTLEVADLRVLYSKGTLVTKIIRIIGKDGKEYLLIPSMVGGDTVRSMSLRTEDLMKFLNEVWGQKKQGEKAQNQKQLEIDAKEKIRKMLAVSTRIKMDMMQRVLGLDADTFSNKIFDWAAEFKFKIDGDFVIIEGGDVTGFLSKLDSEFADWNKKSGGKV